MDAKPRFCVRDEEEGHDDSNRDFEPPHDELESEVVSAKMSSQ